MCMNKAFVLFGVERVEFHSKQTDRGELECRIPSKKHLRATQTHTNDSLILLYMLINIKPAEEEDL